MSTANYGSGLYGTQGPNGTPIGLSPAMLEAMIVNPTIRALIQANGAPNTQTTNGLMNWAASQGNSGRAIMPTIPGLTLPPQIQQIMAQRAPLATIAQNLQKAVPGTPAVNPTTGQFAPGSSGASTPTSVQAPTSGATGGAPRTSAQVGGDLAGGDSFINSIVNAAVAAALDMGVQGGAGPASSGPSGPGPNPTGADFSSGGKGGSGTQDPASGGPPGGSGPPGGNGTSGPY